MDNRRSLVRGFADKLFELGTPPKPGAENPGPNGMGDGHKLFQEFSSQLCDWAKTGQLPQTGNQDLRYGLELQKARLDKFHANIELQLKLRGEHLDTITHVAFSNEKYTNWLVTRHLHKKVDYYLEGRKYLTNQDNEQLYAMITWLNQSRMDGTETYCCPNCGAISRISELIEGCPFCGTRFLMTDLFPKVTTYHFLMDVAMNDREAKFKISKWMLTGALVGVVLNLPRILRDFFQSLGNGGSLLRSFLFALLMLVIAGGLASLLGYAAGAVALLIKTFKEGIRQTPMAIGILRAKKQLYAFMKPFDPGFSFAYFIGKIQGLLKILIFTDDRRNLAVYEGQLEGNPFDNIIDAQFGGAIRLHQNRSVGAYCYLHLDVYMDIVYCQENRLVKKRELFLIVVCKNISRPPDYGFSIKKVACKSCGASFDASKEKHCPFCGASYELKEDDWVITQIQKR